MKVKNRACIRKLSMKTLWASRKRNIIAVLAIALTALLFTSLFTVAMSLTKSYENYTFRQIGGYCHGTFKEVNQEQAAAIAAHPKVKAVGLRTVGGFAYSGVFAKSPAELSFMDDNCTTWSYAQPAVGRTPRSGKEITMDTKALSLLGVEPVLGAQVTVNFSVGYDMASGFEKTDTFTLVGWWEYDQVMPVHYLNVPKDYIEALQAEAQERGMDDFRSDLNVMMASSVNIRGQMEQVDTDLGYTWDERGAENNVRLGVNWGYASERALQNLDFETVVGIGAFLILVIFTGYLIIYNIFQISVTGDIRFYGLLKTIGTTPRQLKRIIRNQALGLCVVGIPAGLGLGWGVGALLVPVVMARTTISAGTTISASPLIFLLAALFALFTVLLSCGKPGKIAAKVSPVEAVRYTDVTQHTAKSRRSRSAGVFAMAFANLGRNKKKTVLVMASLALAVVLLNVLMMFVGGFDMEKFLSHGTCADFIVSTTDYFRFNSAQSFISQEQIREIEENTQMSLSGLGYCFGTSSNVVWMKEENWRAQMERFDATQVEAQLAYRSRKDNLVAGNALIEGLDFSLFEKLQVVEGDISPLLEKDSHAVAVAVNVDDYGNVYGQELCPKVGEQIPVSYVSGWETVDRRTGEPSTEDTPMEFRVPRIVESKDVTYTVCAWVVVPYSMSYRHSTVGGYELILSKDALEEDNGVAAIPMVYLFDTPDEEAEEKAEAYLAELTSDPNGSLMYESKATLREEFQSFQSMFLLVGGLLCFIIGIVGILNFINAIMTGILSRQREFAVLQAVGMTGKQLKTMLIYEGLFYSLGSNLIALVLSLVLNPLAGNVLAGMFWFFTAHFTILPVLGAVPVFALLGWGIPGIMYHQTEKRSVVERLRETE